MGGTVALEIAQQIYAQGQGVALLVFMETYDLPVYPRGMLVEPFVPLLAEKLKVCIHKALESETSNKMSST